MPSSPEVAHLDELKGGIPYPPSVLSRQLPRCAEMCEDGARLTSLSRRFAVAASAVSSKTGAVAEDTEQGAVEVRASDRDREATIELLRQHTADGSLTLDEFADRVGIAMAARTRRQLEAVVSDLPVASVTTVPATRRTKARRWVVAVMSGSQLKGRWRVGRAVTAVALMGGCEVDLRRAEIDAAEVRVTAVAVMGGVDIIVPEGIAVELSGFPIMGGKDMKVADVPVLPGSPLISVRAFPIMGGVTVRTKPERRNSEQRRSELRRNRDHRRLERRGGVRAELPEQSASVTIEGASGPEGTVTVMFSDIAGYSAITERLGDLAAHALLRTHNALLREQLAVHGGREVNSQGDGFMVSFPSATRALRCAVAIQGAFEKYCDEHPDEPIRVHLGLHTGEPVRDGDDLLGRTVIVAARLSEVANADEILVSSLLHDLAESTGEFRFGEPRQVELKGITGTQTVYPVDWRR
jgi:class 3 adenylate cyclase